MDVSMVTGGVRSGKSRWAQDEAGRLGGADVTVIATAEPIDDEMRDRIEAHRVHRPEGWITMEAPRDVGRAIVGADTDVVVLDCLTVLTGMALGRSRATTESEALIAMAKETDSLLSAVDAREGQLIVVTNEVGLSVHPATAAGRWFQDGLGAANQRVAKVAGRVVLMVSGIEMHLR